MKIETLFSAEALADLDEIWEYIDKSLQNRDAANRTIDGILKKISLLEDFSELGMPLYQYLEIGRDYRILVCENYLAFYRYEKQVYIDRILYKRRDYIRALFPSETIE